MKQTKLPFWNSFDEFGLLVGLGHWSDNGRELKYVRYPGETNEQLKERILQVYKHRSNSSYQGLVNSLSRDLLTKRYDVVDKYHYFLSNEPYAQASGIKVYSSGAAGWEELVPQVRASGYSSATSGWIVWNNADVVNNDGTITYGNYSQVLEFIGTSLPDNGVPLKIEYQIIDSFEEDGTPILNWFIDADSPNVSNTEDYRFRSRKAQTPDQNSQIVIHRLNNLQETPYSGVFYTSEGAASSKLKEIANYFNKKHPVEWGKIPWNTFTWENTDNLVQGTLPTLFDASLPIDDSGNIESKKFVGGVNYGESLYMMDIVKEERGDHSGIYAYWYPRIYPGKFYISNTGYYLFENKNTYYQLLNNTTGHLPSTKVPSYGDFMVVGASGYEGLSGQYFTELYKYPLGSGQNFSSDLIYRRSYKFLNDVRDHTFSSGEYYLDFERNLISGVALSGQIQMVWEDPDASGIGKIISGIDLNIYNQDRDTSILLVRE